jgi:hypothetical protein
MTEPIKTIHLDNSQMLFYQLNIIHDIIHDYGFYSNETRWIKNRTNAEQFLEGRYTMTVQNGGGNEGDQKTPTDSSETNQALLLTQGNTTVATNSTTGTITTSGTITPDSSIAPNLLITPEPSIQPNLLITPEPSIQPNLLITPEPSIQPNLLITHEIDDADNASSINANIYGVAGKTDFKIVTDELDYNRINEEIKTTIIFNFIHFFQNKMISYRESEGTYSASATNRKVFIECKLPNNTMDYYEFAYECAIPIDDIILHENLTEYKNKLDGYESDTSNISKASKSSKNSKSTEISDITTDHLMDVEDHIDLPEKEENVIPTILNGENLFELYSLIADEFILFLQTKNYNLTISCENVGYLLTIISDFLNSDKIDCDEVGNVKQKMDVVDYCIYKAKLHAFNSTLSRNTNYTGGSPDDEPNVDDNTNTIDFIEETIDKLNKKITELQTIQENVIDTITTAKTNIIESIKNDNDNEIKKNLNTWYNRRITLLITLLINILKQPGITYENGKLPYIEKNEKYIYQLFELNFSENRGIKNTRGKQSDNIITQIENKFNSGQNDILEKLKKKIGEYLNEKKRFERKVQKKRELEDKLQAKLQANIEKEENNNMGELETIRGQFLNAIAILGLFLNPIPTFTSKSNDECLNSLLQTEINILNYYSKFMDTDERKTYKDLDKRLINVIKDNDTNKCIILNNKPFYNINGKKYAINNAAEISPENKDRYVFCPLTSILDGMMECTIGGTQNDINFIEYGNMNFQITNEDNKVYYNGKLNLQILNKTLIGSNVTYEVNYKGFHPDFEIKTINEFQINIGKIRDLEAHNILGNTLKSILTSLIHLINSRDIISDYILSSSRNNIFLNIANVVMNNDYSNNQRQELLNCLFTILGKGAGDIFQEINAVCKFGGYINKPNTNKQISQWNDSGNAIRLFIANDRPSATRFIFLNKYARDDEINILSFGGYMSSLYPEDWLITERNIPRETGKRLRASTKGGTYTKKQKRGKVNKTKVNKYKTNKKTKKHIQLKKHKKTKNQK